jgi:hypothetical protein
MFPQPVKTNYPKIVRARKISRGIRERGLDRKAGHARKLPPVRISISTLAAVDKWIAGLADPPSRPEAITHLIEIALTSSATGAGTKVRKSKKA